MFDCDKAIESRKVRISKLKKKKSGSKEIPTIKKKTVTKKKLSTKKASVSKKKAGIKKKTISSKTPLRKKKSVVKKKIQIIGNNLKIRSKHAILN
ncbi:MAG: hypothetical protein KZQ83_01080 [gamma proteobacterium symbiont of Taylorina sp.]|nr:hypothetical protein [gamma proteobacterium symbiont of Taylorina sp.]